MKLLLSISLIFSFVLVADDHDADMSAYEPNVAEYYVSTFKEGKDMDDMMRWAEKFNMWADETDHFKNYIAALLVPYYHNGENHMISCGLVSVQILKKCTKVMTIGSIMVQNFLQN